MSKSLKNFITIKDALAKNTGEGHFLFLYRQEVMSPHRPDALIFRGVKLWPMGQIWPTLSVDLVHEAIAKSYESWPAGVGWGC